MKRHHMTANGPVPYTPEEEAARDAEEAANAEKARIAVIDAQIAALEASITERMKREAIIGSTTVDSRTGRTAAQQTAYIDTQIAALRAKRL